jgi:hypothetical protein
VCVIAACDAVEKIIEQVDGSNLSRKVKRPLIASLKAACANFELGEFVPAMNALEAFQHKVDAQLGRTDPATAAALNDAVQKLLDAIDCAARLAGGGQ